ncbi:LCP family protein [Janibacter melonis]|uniref:LCP family protein n=1 Tax=Janibacter melonis TaxID=262209 RepID=UPI002559EA99|nr:LCP family protein [Janibacter melonis]
MPEHPRRPRRPEDGRRDDDAMTFDVRRGRSRSTGGSPTPRERPQRPQRPAQGAAKPAPKPTSKPAPKQPADRPRRRPEPASGRADDTARAIPTGSRAARPAGSRPQGQSRPRQQGRPDERAEPRTRVMPVAGQAQSPRPERPRRPERPATDDRGRPGGPTGPTSTGGGRRRRPLRTAGIVLLCLALVWGGATYWAVSSAWGEVNKVDATPSGDRVAEGDGRNVLLVGSDSREGMTREERNRLGTGQAEGKRTDSIIVLHTGGDRPVLLSIPRDSYVEIPGHGMNKINAAYSIGGAKLLGETIEANTGLHMDGYMEIGFGGFAQVVDAVDGVWICVQRDMDDPKAHIDLKKGCQTLDGKTALGYVRARYSDPEGDIGRAKRQRQFLGSLMGEIATPGTLVQPWKLRSLGQQSGGALTVGEDDSMIETGRAFWAIRSVSKGEGDSIVVPISNSNLPTPVGSAVQWDTEKAPQLFDDLNHNRPLSIDPSKG